MKSTLEPLEGNKVKLSVEVEETEFDNDINAAFRKIAQEVRLPGFRPGKAPRRVLEARIGIAPAREQALRDGIPVYLAKAVREHDVDIIATPSVDITAGEDTGPVAFDATIEVRPRVSVPGYGGLRVELPNPAVTDAELDEAVEQERKRRGELTDTDRPAAIGDFVTVDISADRDGDAVPGLNTEDWLYEVGKAWVAPSFDRELIGASVDDDVQFTDTPSGTEEPADFFVTVKKVQELVAPELTDAWVSETLGEWDTVAEWRDSLRDRMSEVRLGQARQQLAERTTSALAELIEDEPPEALVNTDLQNRAQNFVRQLQAQGIALEQYMAMTGNDPQAFTESLRSASVRAVKADLGLRAVVEAESIDVDDDDLAEEYARIATQYRDETGKSIKKAYEKQDAVGDLRSELRRRKALEWLFDHVEIVDADGNQIDRNLILPDDDDEDEDIVTEPANQASNDENENVNA